MEENLPKIQGTDKQIGWAIDIRQKNVDNMDKYIKMMQASITPGMESVVNKVLSDARATTLKNSPTDATEWINDATALHAINKSNSYTYNLLRLEFEKNLRVALTKLKKNMG